MLYFHGRTRESLGCGSHSPSNNLDPAGLHLDRGQRLQSRRCGELRDSRGCLPRLQTSLSRGPAPGRGKKQMPPWPQGAGTARIPECKVCCWAVRSASEVRAGGASCPPGRSSGLLPWGRLRKKTRDRPLSLSKRGCLQEFHPELHPQPLDTRGGAEARLGRASRHHQCEEWGRSPLPHPHPTLHPSQAPGGLRTEAGKLWGPRPWAGMAGPAMGG